MRIDLEQVLKDKKPLLYRRLPKFLVGWLKRIIHEDDINEILRLYGTKQGVEFARDALLHIGVSRTVYFSEDLSKTEGRYIFASNHPLGGVDAFIAVEAIEDGIGSVKVVVNDVLMQIKPLSSIFVPINKFGSQNANYLMQYNALMASNEQVLFFPAGVCSRKVGGKVCDLEWKRNFITKAIEFKRDVVPVYVEAQNSPFFYRVALWRKRLGIKFNLELILLPSEFFKKRGAHINIYFGPVVPYTELSNGKSATEWAAEIKKMCYNLGKKDEKH